MKKILVVFFLSTGMLISLIPKASSVGYANCVNVSSAQVTKEFGNLVYALQVNDVCDAGVRSYSLTLLSNKYSVPNVFNSYVILYGYSTKVTFSLKNFKPGRYQPALEILSSKDFEKRTISLPEFTIQAPLDCVQLDRSGLDSGSLSQNYSLVLRNACSELDSFAFGNISLQLMGVIGAQFSYQKIYSLSEYGTSFNFNLNGLSPGSYFPTLYLKDELNSGSKNLPLTPFTIQKQTNTPSRVSSNKQVCISGKDYSEECFDYPDWTYEVCSPNQSGKVQIQSGSNWIFGWNFKGTKDLDRCYTAQPFLITITGASTRGANLRLAYTKYQSKAAFYSYFKVVVR
jgi:hypothetical protein